MNPTKCHTIFLFDTGACLESPDCLQRHSGTTGKLQLGVTLGFQCQFLTHEILKCTFVSSKISGLGAFGVTI